MKPRNIALMTITSLSVAIPIALAQRPFNPPASQPMQNRGMMHDGSMMQAMQVSSEFEFLTKMIPHHQEAIDSARLVLEESDRPEMKRFAQDIIQVQTAEVEQMQQWLKEWYPGRNTEVPSTPMMRDLNNLRGDELDQAFLEDMIMHHMGAVMMSQMLLNRNLIQHEPVRPFAQQIAASQRQEIGQMQAWLRDWYGVAGGMRGMMHRPGMMR